MSQTKPSIVFAHGVWANGSCFSNVIAPGGTRVADDSVASALAPHHDAAASQVARRLDTEVLGLLRQVTGVPSSATA